MMIIYLEAKLLAIIIIAVHNCIDERERERERDGNMKVLSSFKVDSVSIALVVLLP